MNKVLAIAAGISAMTAASAAGAAARYAPANILGTGYADEQIAPGVWTVRGASATPGAGHAIAIYRAAELAQAAGVGEMRIVHQRILMTTQGYGHTFVREVAHLTVRAVREPADRAACQEKKTERCITVSVAKMLAQFGPELGQSPGPHPELAAAQPSVHVSGGPIPFELIHAFNARQAAMGRAPLLPAAAPAAQPVSAVSTPQRPLSAYEQGRLAGAAARAAQQPGD